MSTPEDEVLAQARAKKHAEAEVREVYSRSLVTAKTLWGLIYGLLCATFVGAGWTTKMQIDVSSLKEQMASRIAFVAKVDGYIASNNLVNQNLTSMIASLEKRMEENRGEIKEMRPHVEQLWWIKERGWAGADGTMHDRTAPKAP